MRIRALAWLLLSTLLTGCFFEHPLTSGPSKDINSWLLGVWEGTDSKGRTYRARIVPITGDRYYVSFRSLGRKKAPRGSVGIRRLDIACVLQPLSLPKMRSDIR